jgi:hypothetical protein
MVWEKNPKIDGEKTWSVQNRDSTTPDWLLRIVLVRNKAPTLAHSGGFPRLRTPKYGYFNKFNRKM